MKKLTLEEKAEFITPHAKAKHYAHHVNEHETG